MKRVLSAVTVVFLLMLSPSPSEARGPRASQQRPNGQCQVQTNHRQPQGGQRLRLRDGTCNNQQCQQRNSQRGAQQGHRWGQGQGRGGRWQQG